MFNECDFCCEFNKLNGHLFGELLQEEMGDVDISNIDRIVMRSGNLRAIVSLGEVEFGHLLICPTYHVTSFNRLRECDISDMGRIMDAIEYTYEKEFGCRPMYFEHGDPSGNNPSGANCVHHAHLHVLPHFFNLIDSFEHSPKQLASAHLSNLPKDIHQPYILVADPDRKALIYADENLPRQFLRKRYCELRGLKHRNNWIISTQLEETLRSTDKLRSMFCKKGPSQ